MVLTDLRPGEEQHALWVLAQTMPPAGYGIALWSLVSSMKDAWHWWVSREDAQIHLGAQLAPFRTLTP